MGGGIKGLKALLQHPAPWTRHTITLFRLAGILTVLMVAMAYVVLWFGIQGKIAAWLALVAQGVSVLVTVGVIVWAIRARGRDVRHAQKSDDPQ